jgi:hypothetical protein
MTYMPENLSNIPTDGSATEPTTVEKLKTLAQEGTQRTQRISQILKQAFSETCEEFQAGRTVISPIAKEVTAEAVSAFKSKSQQATEAVNQAWQDEESAPDFTERLIKVLKTVANTAKVSLLPKVKTQTQKQVGNLDTLLRDRYGEQYITLKDRFGRVRAWVNTATNSTATVPTETTIETSDTTSATVIEVDSKTIN